MEKMIHIIAFCFPLAIFSYFALIGYATLCLFRNQQNPLQNILLAPTIGITMTLMPVFWLNQMGLPVKSFATVLTLLLIFASMVIVFLRKSSFPFKSYSLFFGIFVLALCLVGRPFLYFGFDWMSYANEDMAGYCLGALRFLNHGYFDIPDVTDMIQGKDKSQYYWFTFVPAAVRSGCELMIAWLSGLTRLNPLQVFMPLIIGFHLTLISATGALLLFSKSWYKIALTACLFLAFSALSTLGVLYELIAQVAGLSVFIAVCILLFEIVTIPQKGGIFRHSILLCLTSCALLIIYPEIASMLALSFIVYFIVNLCKGFKITKEFIFILGLCLLESVIFLNKYWLNIFIFLQYQITEGFTDLKGGLFPYFLMPSGLADLWGAQTIASISEGRWGTISIILGFGLSVLALLFMLRQIPKRYPAAIIMLVMTGLAFYLLVRFKQDSGFALFKLAMYIQPFLLSVVAIGLFEKTSRLIRIGCIALVIVLGAYSQRHYLQYSYGNFGQPFVELPGASSTHLYAELHQLRQKLPSDADIISDTPNVISSKLQSLYFPDKKIHFYSNPLTFYSRYIYVGKSLFMRYSPDLYMEAIKLRDKLMELDPQLAFSMKDDSNKTIANYFYKSHSTITSDSVVLMDAPLRSILNRRELSNFHDQNYVARPIKNVRNHLVFINSSLGQYYYFGESPNISLNGMEKDYYFPENTISGIGRYLLFQVIHPTKKYHLELNITESYSHDGNNLLPQARIIGNKMYLLPLMGRGSARVFSPEFMSRIIKNDPYFMLDLDKNGKAYAFKRKGLMKLYGADIQLDSRLIAAYARNISLISDEDYRRLTPPNSLSKFPDDLDNPNLEYSGLYEDGWISEEAFLKLSQPNPSSKLIIDGVLPVFENQSGSNSLTVYVDGKKILQKNIQPGDFHFIVPVSGDNTKKIIRLHFSRYFLLPKGDDRPIAAKINYIGFEKV